MKENLPPKIHRVFHAGGWGSKCKTFITQIFWQRLCARFRVLSFCCARNPPERSFLRNFSKRLAKNAAKFWRNFFADFRPSISRENGCKKFHEKSSTFSTVHQIKFFHCCNSGGLGAQHFGSCSWPSSRGWLFLGWLFWGASLRVEGVGAEGLALQFQDFALPLVPGGRGCLFRAGARLVQSKKVCSRGWKVQSR